MTRSMTPTVTGTFALHGRVGEVTVGYGVNDDPAHWGYPVLGLPYPDDVARGFPVVEARVEYEGGGYRAFMGWIQVVRYTAGDSPLVVIIDRPPAVLDVDVPFLTMGPCPTLFDAPSTIWADTHWRADSFLVASPDAVMSKTVLPLFGFRWGYDRDASGVVTPRSCVQQPLSVWNEVRPLIAEAHPAWSLLDAAGDD
jgi:hypothetical protein